MHSHYVLVDEGVAMGDQPPVTMLDVPGLTTLTYVLSRNLLQQSEYLTEL